MLVTFSAYHVGKKWFSRKNGALKDFAACSLVKAERAKPQLHSAGSQRVNRHLLHIEWQAPP